MSKIESSDRIREILERASSSSAAQRRAALEMWVELDFPQIVEVALQLIESPYRDVREDVVSFCSEEYPENREVAAALCEYVSRRSEDISAEGKESLLAWLTSAAHFLTPEAVSFVHRCFDDPEAEVRYRAFCVAEYAEETSEDYWAHVERWLVDEDEDFRIVAVQAIERRALHSGGQFDESIGKKLESRLSESSEAEGFHIRLALLRLSPPACRASAVRRMISDIEDARYSYPAIDAVMRYGSQPRYYAMDESGEGEATRASVVEALLRVSRSFLGEPTVRTAAAAAAARLGSEAGRALLESFAHSRRANASYARELLGEIAGDSRTGSAD